MRKSTRTKSTRRSARLVTHARAFRKHDDLQQLSQMRADREWREFMETSKGAEFARAEAELAAKPYIRQLDALIAEHQERPTDESLTRDIDALRRFIAHLRIQRFEAFGFLRLDPIPIDSLGWLLKHTQEKIQHERRAALAYSTTYHPRDFRDLNKDLQDLARRLRKKYSYLTLPPVPNSDNDPHYCEAVERWCLVNEQLPAAQETAKSLKFLDDTQICDAAIRLIVAMRRELLRKLAMLAKLGNGSWSIHFKRDVLKREAIVPVQFQFSVGDEVEEAATKSRVEYQPHDHAPFYDFMVVNTDGQRPRKNTKAHLIESHISYLLERLFGIVDLLHDSLQCVQNGAADRGMKSELWELKQLAGQLLELPFWSRYCEDQAFHDAEIASIELLFKSGKAALSRLNTLTTDTDDGAPYLPASAFKQKVGSRLRRATSADRKGKRVRTKIEGRVKLYSSVDVQRYWNDCHEPSAPA